MKHTFGSFETLGTLNAAIVAMARPDRVGKCEIWRVERLDEASSDLVAACDENKEKGQLELNSGIRISNLIEEFGRPHKHLYSLRSPSQQSSNYLLWDTVCYHRLAAA